MWDKRRSEGVEIKIIMMRRRRRRRRESKKKRWFTLRAVKKRCEEKRRATGDHQTPSTCPFPPQHLSPSVSHSSQTDG